MLDVSDNVLKNGSFEGVVRLDPVAWTFDGLTAARKDTDATHRKTWLEATHSCIHRGRAAAVQYLKFPLGDSAATAPREDARALIFGHSHLQLRVELSPALQRSPASPTILSQRYVAGGGPS